MRDTERLSNLLSADVILPAVPYEHRMHQFAHEVGIYLSSSNLSLSLCLYVVMHHGLGDDRHGSLRVEPILEFEGPD